MRFMLLQDYATIEGVEPMSRWAPEDDRGPHRLPAPT